MLPIATKIVAIPVAIKQTNKQTNKKPSRVAKKQRCKEIGLVQGLFIRK